MVEYFALDPHRPVDHTGLFVVVLLCSWALAFQPLMLSGSTLELGAECLTGIVLWYNQEAALLEVLVVLAPAHCQVMAALNPQPCGLVASH